MPIGKTKSEANTLLVAVRDAGASYEAAKSALEGYEYLNAMTNAENAITTCPSLKGPQEIFDTAQSELTRYYKKKYDAGEYAAVLSANDVRTDWRTDEMKEMVKNVNDLIVQDVNDGTSSLDSGDPAAALEYARAALAIDENNAGATDLCNKVSAYYVELGTSQLDSGDPDGALNYANLAEDANPNNEWVQTLKGNVEQYKTDYSTYEGYVADARTKYYNGNIDGAYYTLEDIPYSGAGNAVRNQNSSFIQTISNDYTYSSNPVVKNSGRWVCNRVGKWADLYGTFENRISRPVKIEVKYEWNGNTKYSTVTLDPYETYEDWCAFTNVYCYSNKNNNTCYISVNNFWIQ
jgi:tetratricopeptide (TPR) repeat protein